MPYAALTPAAPSDPAAFLSAPSANRPPQAVPTPGLVAPFKPSRTDPLNREPDAVPTPCLDQYIASMSPVISANPRDAPHTRRQRRRQQTFAADERR
jgi:hypothetical protein